MGIEAIYRRSNTSKPEPGHKIFPYLLPYVPVTQPNQAWAMDVTYVPMSRGFIYLAAAVDWISRKVLSWRVSISLDTSFCIEAVECEADRGRRPRKLPNTGAPWQADDLQYGSRQPGRAQSVVATRLCRRLRSPSAWTAAAPGVTTSSYGRGRGALSGGRDGVFES